MDHGQWVARRGERRRARARGADDVLPADRAQLADRLHSAVFTGMWHFITVHFALSALFLLACGYLGRRDLVVALVAMQFAAYGAINLLLSLRLGNALRLAQWLLFAGVAILAALGLAAP